MVCCRRDGMREGLRKEGILKGERGSKEKVRKEGRKESGKEGRKE